MTYEKKHVCNCTTGEIELVDFTPEEIAQRDQERADTEVEAAKPQPKSEIEHLRELTDSLLKRVSELEKGK